MWIHRLHQHMIWAGQLRYARTRTAADISLTTRKRLAYLGMWSRTTTPDPSRQIQTSKSCQKLPPSLPSRLAMRGFSPLRTQQRLIHPLHGLRNFLFFLSSFFFLLCWFLELSQAHRQRIYFLRDEKTSLNANT